VRWGRPGCFTAVERHARACVPMQSRTCTPTLTCAHAHAHMHAHAHARMHACTVFMFLSSSTNKHQEIKSPPHPPLPPTDKLTLTHSQPISRATHPSWCLFLPCGSCRITNGLYDGAPVAQLATAPGAYPGTQFTGVSSNYTVPPRWWQEHYMGTIQNVLFTGETPGWDACACVHTLGVRCVRSGVGCPGLTMGPFFDHRHACVGAGGRGRGVHAPTSPSSVPSW
jgi:hypothetical protein